MAAIYKITNVVNNKIYIGQTINTIDKRFKKHLSQINCTNICSALYSAFTKYGKENFIIEAVINGEYSKEELNMEINNVLSLFDGMSCAQIALKNLGIIPDKYYASEIEKQPIKLTQHNFPNTIQLGDVTKWREWNVEWSEIDFIFSGSPCQDLSRAGKGGGIYAERSGLFWVFIDILNHVRSLNPNVKFLQENVAGASKKDVGIMSRAMGLYPCEINSNLVSAQNRPRIYWTNIKTRVEGLFGDVITDIPQPKDRGILLKDILEEDAPEKYYLSDKMIQYFSKREANSNEFKINIRDKQDKSGCFTAGGNSGGLHSDMTLVISQLPRGFNKGNDFEEKSPTLTSNSWEQNNFVHTKNYIQYDVSGKGYKSQQDRAFYKDSKHGALSAARAETKTGVVINERQKQNHKSEDEKANAFLSTSFKGSQANGMTLIGNLIIRRLTPLEVQRLQTVPEWYDMSIVSDTAIYKACGNGWTIDVIAHILSFLKVKGPLHERAST